jgi:hypothetical protein
VFPVAFAVVVVVAVAIAVVCFARWRAVELGPRCHD